MKKKIFLVPHCHWDREWYFSKDTSDVLLHNNIKELINNIKDQKFFFDGQWGLLDDYVQDNPHDFEKIKTLLQEEKISSGPLYSQPDTLNSQIETTIRNLELGEQIAKNFGVKNHQTAYLPDTFGFSSNILNMFKAKGVKNFVFWRGLPRKEVEKQVLFKWENQNYNVKSLCLRNGYYHFGSRFPYNGNGGKYPEKWNPQKFADLILKTIDENKGFQQDIIFPLGGDQGPFTHNQRVFFREIEKHLDNYEIEFVANYEQFFKKVNSKKLNSYQGDLFEPFTGKIHRTIASSRYDIKKLFRQAEDKLYYLLEPFEVFYNNIDANYDFTTYKQRRILKPLMIASTHDSLGACNTDSTNSFQFNRLKLIHENIDSQIDLISKKLLQEENCFGDEIFIFNPAPFESSVFKKMVFYSSKYKQFNVNEQDFFIYTISSQNISLKEKPIYKIEVLAYFEKLKPLTYQIINENVFISKKTKFLENKVNNLLKVSKDKITFNKTLLSFEAIEEVGDSYDSSPGKEIKLLQEHKLVKTIFISSNKSIFNIESKVKINNQKQLFLWTIFLNGDDFQVLLDTKNKFKNVKISLVFEKLNTKNIYFSQNLALTKAINKKIPSTWKEYLHEKPVNVFTNDGIITDKDFTVLTFGNNETFVENEKVKLTLFRTYDLVTKNNLPWRPSTSGLSWKESSNDSQLQKHLHFDFVFSTNKNLNWLLNKYKYVPYIYKNQDENFTANKMSKFVINNILNKKPKQVSLPTIDGQKAFISAFYLKDKKLQIRLMNLLSNSKQQIQKGNQKESLEVAKNEFTSVVFNLNK